MNNFIRSAGVLLGLLLTASFARADITVGFVTSQSGNASSIGIPYLKGMLAALAYRSEMASQKVHLIQLDDQSDPSIATQDARKLIEEDHVDVLIGTAAAPSTNAMMEVAREMKVPMIAVSPLIGAPPSATDQWAVSVPPLPSLHVQALVNRMKQDGVSNVAFIGFSDAWGDLIYGGAKAAEDRGDIKLVTNERYTRSDISVTAQVLRIMAARPGGVLLGSSGTQGALPLLGLAQRGYTGKTYGPSSLVNADFVRVAGKSGEGLQVSTGPITVAEQLPDGHFAKELDLTFRSVYEKVNGAPTTDSFSAYAFDSMLILADAAERAVKVALPGTPEFRGALRDAILATHELHGVQAIYDFRPGSYYGVDARSLVVVRLTGGVWKYLP